MKNQTRCVINELSRFTDELLLFLDKQKLIVSYVRKSASGNPTDPSSLIDLLSKRARIDDIELLVYLWPKSRKAFETLSLNGDNRLALVLKILSPSSLISCFVFVGS